jgi:ribonuclease-3
VLQIGGTAYGKGTGHSKKEAEQEAAADAWRTLNSKVALNGKADSPADPAHSA